LPQIVVDAEIVAMIRRLLGEVEISPTTIGREMIERVGIGGNFLKEKGTRQAIRDGVHFIPRVASRLPYDAWQAEGRTELDAAVARVEEILAVRAGRAPNLSEDQVAALREICAVDEAAIPAQ
jgi:trimethylamine:corrinoid methyltransferase-like protein